jgi:N-acetylglucosaminyldiphosphoundecaprenol N-acetyl-beta-D-mannosaminyltransferase
MQGTDRKRIVSLEISVVSYQQAMDRILELATERESSYACFSNVHMIVEAHKSLEFRKMVNQSNFAFADGMPLVFALKWLYGIRQDRIAGMDFMADVLKACEVRHLSIFFYGSTPEILASLQLYVTKKYPTLHLAGMISPPFRELSMEENNSMIDQINASGANIVLVGLGCPKQETWMAKNSSRIQASLLGVGGAFALYAGNAQRAPQWMRNVGLEWLYRLSQEPRRLAKRYVVTNSHFVYLFIKQFFSPRL